MAINPRNRKPMRALVTLLVLVAALFAGIGGTVHLGSKSGQWTPKLALDLAGGHEMVLKARVEGQKSPSKEQLKEAVSIIRKRVDSTGVAEAQVTTLGSDKIVVSLPGTPSQTVLDSLKKSSQMRFRTVLMAGTGLGQQERAEQAAQEAKEGGQASEGAPATGQPAPTTQGTAAPSNAAPSSAAPTTAAPGGTAALSASPTTANGIAPAGSVIAEDPTPTTVPDPASGESTSAPAATPSTPAATQGAASPSPTSAPAPQTPSKPTFVPGVMQLTPAQINLTKIWKGTLEAPKAGEQKELNASSSAWITPGLFQFFANVSCTNPADREMIGTLFSAADQPMVACSTDGQAKYILGPSEIPGSAITDASSGFTSQNGVQTSVTAVSLELDSEGTEAFRKTTERLFKLKQDPAYLTKLGLDEKQKQTFTSGMGDDPMAAQYLQYLEPDAQTRNRFAMVLDGEVIQAPGVESAIADGHAQITGGFTPETGKLLANQLKFGALPVSFTPDMQRQVSPQLGGEQLRWGLVAGLVGFLLVVLYSLLQYRALGMVTVASLIVSGLITYAVVVLLGHFQNFRLSMAGITGLIVAIGVTADSFIVYFERVRDEVRDGRQLRSAVQIGWERAKRTILISDAVNLLAALVLYFLSESNVKAFAYTLGLTTVFDVLIVFLFTHPMLTMLATTKFFGQGHPLSGFSPEQLGASKVTYAGRGRVTIAEAKAAAARGGKA